MFGPSPHRIRSQALSWSRDPRRPWRRVGWWFEKEAPELGPNEITLAPLSPAYDPHEHRNYVEWLSRGVADHRVQNIALTGGYGTGKSSVLLGLQHQLGPRMVSLSLSSSQPRTAEAIDDEDKRGRQGPGEAREVPEQGAEPDLERWESSPKNRIQRELVRQLLYQLRPEHTPDSRFPRLRARSRLWVAITSTALALIVTLFGVLAGWFELVLNDAAESPALRTVAYALSAAALAYTVYGGRILLGRRAKLSSLNAGPAHIKLADEPASYFDKYLDEIVYYFQVSRRDVIVFEDIDRFEDIEIFDTLRSLNTLLNSANQLRGRTITFIYAVRDSVFEHIGEKDAITEEGGDPVQASLRRAPRTKFFDLIVPVVPPISHYNARDHMGRLLKEAGQDASRIDLRLRTIAARHVPDLRLLKNVVNEYLVFKHRLLDEPDEPMPGLDEDKLFALVVYKNTHLADFEQIKNRKSSLDNFQATVRTNIRTALDAVAETESWLARRWGDAESKAKRLGGRLTKALAAFNKSGLSSREVDHDFVQSAEFWTEMSAATSTAVFRLGEDTGHNNQRMSYTRSQVEDILGEPLDSAAWTDEAYGHDSAVLDEWKKSSSALRRGIWKELLESTMPTTELPRCSGRALEPPDFNEVIKSHLKSELLRELVKYGYVTEHFAVFAASFQGEVMSAEATDYWMRYIETDTSDAYTPLSRDSVLELWADPFIKEALRSGQSILNISIMNVLLDEYAGEIEPVVTDLPGGEEASWEFLGRYLQQGEHADVIVAMLAPKWSGIFTALSDGSVKTERAVGLIDTALAATDRNLAYETGGPIREFIARHYRDMEVLRSLESEDQAKSAVAVLDQLGVVLADLGELTSGTVKALRSTRAYEMTAGNLRVLTDTHGISLDEIAAHEDSAPGFFDNVLDRINEYLTVVSGADPARTAMSPGVLLRALTALDDAGAAEETVDQLVKCSSRQIAVNVLSDAPQATWTSLIRHGRLVPSAQNLYAYIVSVSEGVADEHVASLLQEREITAVDDLGRDARRELAIAILNIREANLPGDLRVAHAAKLVRQEATLELSQLKALNGDVPAELLAAELVNDDREFFERLTAPDAGADSGARISAADTSMALPGFINPELFEPDDTPSLLAIASIRQVVLDRLPEYLRGAGPSAATRTANLLARDDVEIDGELLALLRELRADRKAVLPLIAKIAPTLNKEDYEAAMRWLGTGWQEVIDGEGQVTVDLTDSNERLLERARSLNFLSSYRPDPYDERRWRGYREKGYQPQWSSPPEP